MFSWGARPAPSRTPSDEAIPAFALDDTSANRGIMLNWTLHFDTVLDAERLRSSLERLLKTGDWRKIGGRLRLDADGKLEIHVPKTFTADRPAFRYRQTSYDIKLDEHPIVSRIPVATADPSSRPILTNFAEPDVTSIDELLYSDLPQLGLHVVSFTDATLVDLIWPHTMSDAMGCHDLLKNWCHVLADREGLVSPFLGCRTDPLERVLVLPEADCEPWALHDLVLDGLGMFMFAIRFLIGILWHPSTEQRIIFFPERTVAGLRERAAAELDARTFLSDGDLLTAWCTRVATSDSKRPVSVMNVVEMRSRAPAGVFDLGGAYVQNLVFPAFTTFRGGAVHEAPIGLTALAIRRSLAAQVAPGQVVAAARMMAQRTGRHGEGKQPPVVGEPSAQLVVFSNWTKGKFFEVADFGPAVIKGGDGGGGGGTGKPVYMQVTMLGKTSLAVRNVFNFLGKDAAGNVWANAVLTPAVWRRVDAELAFLAHASS